MKWLFLIVCLFTLTGLTQIDNVTDPNITNLYNYAQPKEFRVVTTTPTVNQINERELVILASSVSMVTPRIYTKINNTLWWTKLSSGG